jgi:hypothetical protein
MSARKAAATIVEQKKPRKALLSSCEDGQVAQGLASVKPSDLRPLAELRGLAGKSVSLSAEFG